jgi:phytoene synthase
MEQYHKVSALCSKEVTQRYSTSFSLAVLLLGKRFRDPIYGIYGFVRLADEIVDSFYGFNQADLLEKLRADTFDSIQAGISTNPILHSFQMVVNRFGIETEVVEAFLDSMAMDLYKKEYDPSEFHRYVYGSAEAVGLMCLRVFCEGKPGLYNELKHSARKLGEAFQKVNFLRDLKDDYEYRGRSYFPGVDFENLSNATKSSLEADIEKDFSEAFQGILRLPTGARMGVYLAYRYYLILLQKIKRADASQLMQQRYRISNFNKAVILSKSYIRHAFGLF